MKRIESSCLKAILHSKRANMYYLEYCRVMQKDGRIVYVTDSVKEKSYWNIPIANTTVIMLGSGTSITQAAMRMVAQAGVLVGFCGGGCSPLFAGTSVEWLTPQGEYRQTEYAQGWMGFWQDDVKRLVVAKQFQHLRVSFTHEVWGKDTFLHDHGLHPELLEPVLTEGLAGIDRSENVTELLLNEARMTKALYKVCAQQLGTGKFTRSKRGCSTDEANQFLNHGNYLAYGCAASTLWVLGIPHGLAVMHGKTRRGALVFDVADLIKDACVLPRAFAAAQDDLTSSEFRRLCLSGFTKFKAMDMMFNAVKDASRKFSACR